MVVGLQNIDIIYDCWMVSKKTFEKEKPLVLLYIVEYILRNLLKKQASTFDFPGKLKQRK